METVGLGLYFEDPPWKGINRLAPLYPRARGECL
jgi:hypothetical protein